ncbi:MAG: DUF4445 domain-containing protein [Verrucomicrobia bacterium]|nr:DUF4445 domain-containing protein [Verrucomicrobiota bacterium]
MKRTFQLQVESPKGVFTITAASQRLTELLRHEHLPLNIRCGQRGLCDGCDVELVRGTLVNLHTGAVMTAPATLCACQHRLDGDAAIRIPDRSLLAHKAQIVSEFRVNIPRAHAPLAKTGLGAAVDIGTTTVAVLLVDLRDGKIVGRSSDFNKQMHHGDDVATRIGLCAGDKTMVARLQEAIVQETILPLLGETRPVCFSVTGNTTMLHLFAGVDPTPMGTYPFRPEFLEHRVVKLPAFGDADVHLLPSAAAYIGSDITAGILASGLAYDDGPSLLVDVGTNGEIVLKAGGHLLGCATAAGPAFEGAGLTNGVRATEGAIQKIRLEPLHLDVIGKTKPIGICGSAYVDFLAEGRRVGLLNERGRLKEPVFQVAPNIAITETDIAHLLQSKAAIGAGVLSLLERAKLTASQIKRVYMAGGFGLHINVAHAIACGLLPGFRVEQVQVVGNTSLAGAYLALLDGGALEEIRRVSRQIEVVELNLDAGFESRYIDNLSL